MAKVYTDNQDELTITNVIKNGFKQPGLPKWAVLRVALARSLRIDTPPDEGLDRRESAVGGAEYSLEQLTGEGKQGDEDVTILFCALLSQFHEIDLFSDNDLYVKLLQRHVRRGLREIRSGWMETHDFHDYLLHELFGDLGAANTSDISINLREKLVRALGEIGISADVTDAVDGPRLTRYLVKLRDANDYNPLLRGLDKLSFVLGLGEMGVFASPTNEPMIVALDIPRTSLLWRSVPSTSLNEWINNAPEVFKLPIFVGQDVTGKSFGFDLATAPHLLIGGTTGSGKSVCLHAIIISLLLKFSSNELKLILIDPKRVEMAPYANLPHVPDGVLTDIVDTIGVLNRLLDEMQQRESALATVSARDIDDPRAYKLGIPRIVVIVEELADLLMQSGAIEEPLIRLAQKARATGIHLVLATQRPDANTFSGLLRSNVPSRIALTVQKGSESKIIIDESGAEKLLGRGDMLLRLLGKSTIRLHGVFLNSDDIANSLQLVQRKAK